MASRAGAVREGNGTRTIINNDAKIFDWETSWKDNEACFEWILVTVSRHCKLKNGIYSRRSLYRSVV
jgi:hypothetical protein